MKENCGVFSKRITGIFLVLCLLVTMVPVNIFADETESSQVQESEAVSEESVVEPTAEPTVEPAVFSNGTKKAVTGYTYAPTTALSTANTYARISYKYGTVTKTATVTITVKPKPVALSSIAVTTKPKKTSYYVGEKFDKTGMVVTAVFSNGTKKAVTGYTYAPTTTLSTANTYARISYKYGTVTKTATVAITVKPKPVTLSSIAVTTKPKRTSYYVGEKFSKTGMVVTAVFSNGTKKTVTSYTYAPTTSLKSTDKYVKIYYKYGSITKSTTVTIAVKSKPVTLSRIAVTTKPKKTSYYEGEKFSKTGMVVTAVFSNGTKKAVTSYTYSPTTSLKTTNKYVKIYYKYGSITKSTTVTIAVKPKPVTLSRIAVTTKPKKTSYYVGEKFNKTGMVVTAVFSNGTKKAVTSYTYSPTGTLKYGTTYITVSYKYKTTTKSVRLPIKVRKR